MPTFKPKVNKKINVNSRSIVTLDKKHKDFVIFFIKMKQ